MQRTETVSWLMGTGQRTLCPHLEEGLASPLTEQAKRLGNILARVHRENDVPQSASRQGRGRPIQEREAIARSFVAKAVLGYPHPRSLLQAWRTPATLRALGGFATRRAVPSASTCARACAAFAARELATTVPEALVPEPLSTALIGHGSRDATAIQGREKPGTKGKPAKGPRQKGRPATGAPREPTAPQPLDVPRRQSAQDASALLPTACDRGVKNNATGSTDTCNGFQLHVDVHARGLPLRAIVPSASVHASQVAIPLLQRTSGTGTSCSALREAAYDARQIWEPRRALGPGPIMDRNPRGGTVVPLAPHEAPRDNARTASERFNSRLKAACGGRNVMVRGAGTVRRHLMFGVVALCAAQWRNVTGCGRSQTSSLTRREWCAHHPAQQRPMGCPAARQAHTQLRRS